MASVQLKPGSAGLLDPVRAAFREAMARFPTGVAIVTTDDENQLPHGFTASSFCSVSLNPPMVLVCLATSANSYPVFNRNQHFAINVLQPGHADLALRFASKGADKFAGGEFVRTANGAVVLSDALAVVECSVAGRHPAGDHVIIVGQVENVVAAEEGRPAVYFDRRFRALCPAVDVH